MSTYEERLKAMEESWKAGRQRGPGQVPDGEYVARLQGAELREAMSSGRLMIQREHLILEGEYEGDVVRDYMHLETERGPWFIAQWIEAMELEAPESPAELPEILDYLTRTAPTVRIQTKRSGDFINVRVLELIDRGETDDAEGGSESEPEAEAGSDSESGSADSAGSNEDDFDDLIDLAEANGISIPETAGSVQDVVQCIREARKPSEWDPATLTDAEVALLKKYRLIRKKRVGK